jgi:hypothetical protein
MRIHRKGATLAAALCTVALAFGGLNAHADTGVRQEKGQSHATAARHASGQAHGTAAHAAAKQVCGPPYLSGDPDLGPRYLPTSGWLGGLVRGYQPLGGLPPQFFLSRYWEAMKDDYRYPPDWGFARSGNYPNGRLLIKKTQLLPGMRLDRFGSNFGSFLSPLGVPFGGRALPPRSLNTNAQDPLHLCNYHAFRVLKPFHVDAGPAAPAFEQKGGATQYHLLSKYVPEAPQTPEELPVNWLLQNGYLEEIDPTMLSADARITDAGVIDAEAANEAGNEAHDEAAADVALARGAVPEARRATDGGLRHRIARDPRRAGGNASLRKERAARDHAYRRHSDRRQDDRHRRIGAPHRNS